MKWLKYVSTDVRRKKFECTFEFCKLDIGTRIYYTIQLKLFGMFWISYKEYVINKNK